MKHLPIGRYAFADFYNCQNHELLGLITQLKKILKKAVKKSGATLVCTIKHKFKNGGISIIAILGESHLAIHTWPEYSKAHADCYTCGESCKPEEALLFIKEKLGAEGEITVIARGRSKEGDVYFFN